jgi:activator of HSP90 ATPase
METKTIKQSLTFQASPHEVYEALMDSEKHSKFTGAKASISREIGGQFTAFDGGLSGNIVELVPDERIVQSWRASADGWPEDHYSTAIFLLESVKDGTRLNFTQTEVPAQCYDTINQGWYDYYWKRMKKVLEH